MIYSPAKMLRDIVTAWQMKDKALFLRKMAHAIDVLADEDAEKVARGKKLQESLMKQRRRLK